VAKFPYFKIMVAAVAVWAGSPVLPAAAAKTAELRVRLSSPAQAFVHRPGTQSVQGAVTVRVPSSWVRRRATDGGTVAHMLAKLAPGCTAEVEVTTWAGANDTRPSVAIAEAMAFWFYAPVPPRPFPVPIVAQRIARDRAWALGVPPGATPSEGPVAPRVSPFFGVVMQRMAAPDHWASASIGVRRLGACGSQLPHSSSLRSAIETALSSATFRATFGRVKNH
jgi:hypothetical protein